MFKLTVPLLKKFIWNGKTCECTQLFGENKNRYFYDSRGHLGVDFATARPYKYKKYYNKWTKVDRTQQEIKGRIPIVACHDGELNAILYDDKQGLGWGVTVTKEVQEKGLRCQYKTIYWHIETPWSSLSGYRGLKDIIKVLRRKQVARGAIIAIGGDNGKSTGAHLHLGLRRRYYYNGSWTKWDNLDPMLYFDDKEVAYHRWYGGDYHTWYYRGQEITREEFNKLNL